nr:hypothetical protein CFP56_62501 [Quercus suber]
MFAACCTACPRDLASRIVLKATELDSSLNIRSTSSGRPGHIRPREVQLRQAGLASSHYGMISAPGVAMSSARCNVPFCDGLYKLDIQWKAYPD